MLLAAERVIPLEVFYSYAPEDELLLIELEKHLSTLKRQGLIANWHRQQIVAGMPRIYEIDMHLRRANIILLLVSSDFLASDYYYDHEMQWALKRHRDGNACVIPVILRDVDWASAPFAGLQPLPKNALPITRWPDKDQAFSDVARGIREAAKQLWLKRGNVYYQTKDYQSAFSAYQQVLALDADGTVYPNMGHILYATQNHARALEAYDQAAKHGHDDVFVHVNMGHILYASQSYTRALEAYEQAVKHNTNNALVYVNMGHILYAAQNHTRALEVYKQAVEYGHDDADTCSYEW